MTCFLFYYSASHSSLLSSNEVTPENLDHHHASSKNEHAATEHQLPKWILDYFEWHKEVRRQFPGSELFQNPNAPPILIRTCLGLCGGLNDRLGQLPWDIYLANQTGRVLLIHWHRPAPLEHFLTPNEIDWTVPRDVEGFFNEEGTIVSREGMRKARAIPDLFDGFASANPEKDFWSEHLDHSLQRATSGKFKNEKVLRHRILGHINEEELEARLRALGETDTVHWTPSFGKIFFAFFKLSDPIQHKLESVFRELGLRPREYSAVHCRVRHPKAMPQSMMVKGKNEDYPADKSGLPWEGKAKEFAIETATKAIKCIKARLRKKEKVYFFSDSNDLVRYIAHDLLKEENTAVTTVEKEAEDVVRTMHIVARDALEENAHIDRQKGRDIPAYYGTFLDLFLAIHARCLSYGIGYYAIFAAKISGTQCKLLYQEEYWGGEDNKRANSRVCPVD
ncbi:hypothetical protein FisN_5Hh511 [Fistulifera solaris]|jgi:hypothetical protein|uniref:Uncharacterized protein n=1 Tax=Fistulifera solaris TaxID=1519565 RepID=A0A1Z5JSW9_FISSO|nr:hypothetical protein FisN_5Hh511 [Fistulifera solaris]|eukprot:GAX17125.1 hypothetical protein FisN_5Hh511 [Fistulifera solaris]